MKPPENRPGNRHPPPEETRWKPGQSGNPGGRPKGKPVTDELRRLMEEQPPNDPDGRSYARLLAQVLLHAALKGKVDAARELLDRVEGRVPHEVAAAVATGVPLTSEQAADRLNELIASARDRANRAAEADRQAADQASRGLPAPGKVGE
jgi:hypothetical protein